MSSADLRYPRQTLWADYGRAGAGVLLCGAPLLALEVNHWLALILVAGFVLFALFLVRTALRHHTRYVLGPDTLCADGPAGAVVEWNRLDRLKLSYFSTKRDRSDGWMQLTLGSAGGRTLKIDSSLDGFHDVVERFLAGRQIVLDDEIVLGDADQVAGVQHFFRRQLVAVDFNAVLAVVVLENPATIFEGELAVQAGDVWEAEADIARIAPTDG